ncbi:FAD/NAD(P)-binding domain-containing protein [Guyanagaster necrorhizus]|uniref:FAD/NAD(P)-binding domain-containing protein n=1 Tax=Guyanagaster necrorhizus TaxID=856835 RepID=A0A9P7VL67_9AGAR|nr:FAD/NAD(P)-binding domain-containing protein [Guyanagaster necrorhizus MCA 3950]KAG7441944.1 FAD/NAD(P)-binding domain-containing protein [Guyanagaster necrorhizus MCA 3950]
MFRRFQRSPVPAEESTSPKPNVVVIGGSYVGGAVVDSLASSLYRTHNIVLIEKNSHFQHLFAFPRVSVVPGFENRAFIPFTNAFHGSPPGSTSVVHAIVEEVLPGKVVLDNGTGRPGRLVSYEKAVETRRFRDIQEGISKARHITVIGGGAYGVQTATDIKDHDPSKKVTVIHSRPNLMSRFHPKLHEIVMEKFKAVGIEAILGQRVTIPEGGFPNDGSEFVISLANGKEVKTELAIVCIGAVPLSAPLLSLSPSSVDPQTKYIKVRPTLQIADPDYPNVFAVGDVADTGAHKAARPGGTQARIAAYNIEKLVQGRDSDLQAYYPDTGGIGLSLGFVRFRNPSTPGGEPSWRQGFKPFKTKGNMDAGCRKMWDRRAPGVKDYDL